jgi:uncharacterized membrane protein
MSNITDTPDTTGDYSRQEIESGNDGDHCLYHRLDSALHGKRQQICPFPTNQGLILLILAILYLFVYRILLWIFGYGFIITIVGLFGLVITALWIIGIVNAASGKAKELPVIGGFRFLN